MTDEACGHKYDEHGVDLELEGSRQEGKHEIHSEGHFNGFAIDQIHDFRPNHNKSNERE